MLRLIPGPRAEQLSVDDLLSVLSCLTIEGGLEKTSKMFTYLAGQLDTLRALGLISVIDVQEEDNGDELDDPARKTG